MNLHEPQPWYFTFMHKQRVLANRYVRIFGTHETARRRMNLEVGPKWAFQYCESDFLPQIERFGLEEVSKEEAAKYIQIQVDWEIKDDV